MLLAGCAATEAGRDCVTEEHGNCTSDGTCLLARLPRLPLPLARGRPAAISLRSQLPACCKRPRQAGSHCTQENNNRITLHSHKTNRKGAATTGAKHVHMCRRSYVMRATGSALAARSNALSVLRLLHPLQQLLQLALLVQLVQDVAASRGRGEGSEAGWRHGAFPLRLQPVQGGGRCTEQEKSAWLGPAGGSSCGNDKISVARASVIQPPPPFTLTNHTHHPPLVAHLPPTNSPLMKICAQKQGVREGRDVQAAAMQAAAGAACRSGQQSRPSSAVRRSAARCSAAQPPAGWWASA